MLDKLTDALVQFINGFTSWEVSVIRAGDLTVSEVHAIEVMGQYGEMNMKNLAQKLGVTTGTITVTVDRLETKGYAIRHMPREDRRVYLISLTEKGLKAFQEHHKFHLGLTAQLLSMLTEEEALQFLNTLQKINAEII